MARQRDNGPFKNLRPVLSVSAMAGVLTFSLSGCFWLLSEARKDHPIQAQTRYMDAFERAIKACREVDLGLGVINKDAGQVQCNSGSLMAALLGEWYGIDVYLEKEGDALKRVDVKAHGYSYLFPTNTGAQELSEKYLNALKGLGVQ